MRTQIGLVSGLGDWLLCGLIILIASVGKFGGSLFAARLTGLGWRDSSALGVLMNTRGLMELIVLNIGLELRVLSPTLFAMLVLMAIVTTFMTTPILHFITRGRSREDEPARAVAEPTTPPSGGGVLVPISNPEGLAPLLDIAAAATRPEDPPPRVLALVRRPSGGIRSGLREIDRKESPRSPVLTQAIDHARAAGSTIDAQALWTDDAALDILELAAQRTIGWLLLGYHRPVFGGDLLGGVVKEVLDGMSERAVNVGVVIHGHERAIDRVIAVVDDSFDGKAGLELAARIVQQRRSTLHAVLVPNAGETNPPPALEETLREASKTAGKLAALGRAHAAQSGGAGLPDARGPRRHRHEARRRARPAARRRAGRRALRRARARRAPCGGDGRPCGDERGQGGVMSARPGVWMLLALLPSLGAAAAAAPVRTFHVTHEYKVARGATVWVPLPSDDPWQTVRDLRVEGAPWERVYDARWGNAAARLHPTAGATITVRYEVTRRERGVDLSHAAAAATGAPPSGYAAWLQPDLRVPLDARVRKIAADVTAGKTTALAKARAAYDYVRSTMRYDKPAGPGQGWGQGDIEWACDKKYGNCTDFHALFIGLMRASGIPARFSIGYSIPNGAGGDIPGYHCWADFYVDGVGWVPVDASEAWKHKEKAEYFFGHHDADRVQLATGRDVPLPGARGAALNYFIYPYAEAADGAPVEIARKTTYSP